MLVLTIMDDLVGFNGYQKKNKKKKNTKKTNKKNTQQLAFTLSKKHLDFKPTEKIAWFSGRRNKDGLNPKYQHPPPPQKKKNKKKKNNK